MSDQPEVRVTLYAPGEAPRDITLQYPLDPVHESLLHSLHEGGNNPGVIECRMHDNDPSLRDLRGEDNRVHGAWLYLRANHYAALQNRFALSLCHWPKGITQGSHAVPARMTIEHRRRQEYIADRGSDFGYSVDLEKSIAPRTVTDVVISGSEVLAAEVQQSGISVGTLIRRDRRVAAVGAVPTWIADSKNPPWRFRVAHVETNERFGMDPGTWTVSTGPRAIEEERCTPSSRVPCPRGRGWCGRYHRLWVPMRRLTVDSVVEAVPGGGLVRFYAGKSQGWILVQPEDRDKWLDEHPEVAGQTPGSQRSGPRPTGGIRHNHYSPADLRKRISTTTGAVIEPDGPEQTYCIDCGEPLAAKKSEWAICSACFSMPRLRELIAEHGDSPEISRPEPVTGLSTEMWGLLAPGFDH